ncbi:MAG: GAF domain-containing protein, partial [Gammaproteobacteria bacterium]|nr:GAF domain-containing protein [Gammaproteobacteria bacterium]
MLEALRRIIQEVNAAKDLDQALAIIVTRVKQAMSADVCSVYLTDFNRKEYVLMATDGLNPEAVGKVRLALNEGLVSVVSERAEPLNLDNAPDHPRYRFVAETGEDRYHAFLGAPIIHHREVLGVLVVRQRARRKFDDNEVTLLVTIAAQLAGGIAHARVSGGINGLSQHRQYQGRAIEGLAGAPGVGIGQALVVYPPTDLDAIPDRKCDDAAAEVAAFESAVDKVRGDIETLAVRLRATLPAE